MVTRWDPFTDFQSLRQVMNRLIDDSMVARPAWNAHQQASSFAFDLYESADDVVVRFAIPGLDLGKLDVTVAQGALIVKGYRGLYSGDQEKQYTWHARNLGEGQFGLSVALPTAVNADNASAAYEAGILTVSLPKADTVKPKKITIKAVEPHEALTAGA